MQIERARYIAVYTVGSRLNFLNRIALQILFVHLVNITELQNQSQQKVVSSLLCNHFCIGIHPARTRAT